MTEKIRKSPAKYCVIGHPVSHSLSPLIMNRAFSYSGISAEYSIIDSKDEGLSKTISRLKSEGYAGWNVTMPDKTDMCDLVDEISDEADLARSVNTVRNTNGHLFGTSTDGIGFLYAAETLGVKLAGNKITLFGAGGAASAILICASLHGAKEISVFCRSERSRLRAHKLSESLLRFSGTSIRIFSFDNQTDMRSELSKSVLLVNATNVGMGEQSGLSLIPNVEFFNAKPAVFDVIYSPAETVLLKTAKKAGCKTANGLPMLYGQAAESFRIWTGKKMPPLDIIFTDS